MDELEATMAVDQMNVDKFFKAYEPLIINNEDQALFDAALSSWQDYVSYNPDFMESSRQLETVATEMLRSTESSFDQFSDNLNNWDIFNEGQADQTMETSEATYSASQQLIIGVLIGAAVVAFALGFLLARSLANAAREMVRAAEQIAQKDLATLAEATTAIANGDLNQTITVRTSPLTYQSQDEMGDLARAFNQMIARLQNTGTALGQVVADLGQRMQAEQQAKEYLEQTVDKYMTFVGQVAEGDLTTRLSLNGNNDSLTILGRNLNNMVERLTEITRQIREANANLTAAAAEILAATTQQASGATEQSSAISQTSTTIDEVKTIVEQSFAKAQAVAEQSQRTTEISQSGQQAVVDTVESMGQIKERVEGIAENILALSEQTQQIGEITATVNEIASQSNLLALNASVEAARAGEHGKGFAVVAVEVRNLAEQSKQATAQVKAILNEIQRATNAAVMATEEGTKGVDAGVHRTGQAGETIQQLAASIAESTSAAQQIVASAQQQTTGMEQIALAMENINQATVQNLASTRQAEKAAQDLSSLAKQMESLVARYKLD
jgi:methyl-accepting chemotaxis protein